MDGSYIILLKCEDTDSLEWLTAQLQKLGAEVICASSVAAAYAAAMRFQLSAAAIIEPCSQSCDDLLEHLRQLDLDKVLVGTADAALQVFEAYFLKSD